VDAISPAPGVRAGGHKHQHGWTGYVKYNSIREDLFLFIVIFPARLKIVVVDEERGR
jgi:hypothetical protein